MRLLFLTCHLPYPPHSGGRLREHQLLGRLTQRFDVHVAAVTKTLADDRAAVHDIPWAHDGVSLFGAAQLVGLDGVAPQVARHRSDAATTAIGKLIDAGDFDVVHVEGFYLWQHLPCSRPPAVLVEQNIEWQLFAQRGLRAEAELTRAAELGAWREADALGAITPEDRHAIEVGCGRAPALIPDGADHLGIATRARRPRRGRRLLMVGNFAYEPNVDGAQWLIREVMPLIRTELPEAHLQLVGASPPAELLACECDHVEVTGRVPEVKPYLDAADVVVCPLRFGGGVKVKALEALAAGKAIVSTPNGCQGLGAAAAALRVASAPGAFAAAALELLLNPKARARAETDARVAAARLPSWDVAADALADCWRLTARRSLAAA